MMLTFYSFTSCSTSLPIILGCTAYDKNYHRLSGLNNFYFPQFWKLKSPGSKYQLIWFLVSVLFLICGLKTSYILTKQREIFSHLSIFIRGLIPFMKVLPSWPNYIIVHKTIWLFQHHLLK